MNNPIYRPDLRPRSRWPLRIDIMVGVLLAGVVWVVLAALAGVALYALAADAVEDELELETNDAYTQCVEDATWETMAECEALLP